MFHSFIAHVYDNHINLRFLYIFGGSGLLWGVKLTQLMSIFNSKTVWNLLIKIQLTKSGPKRTREWKVPSLMPIRVNGSLQINILFVKIISYPTGQIDQTCSCWLQLNCLTKRYTHESQFLERLIKINRPFGHRFNFFAKWFEGIFELVPQFTFSLKNNKNVIKI